MSAFNFIEDVWAHLDAIPKFQSAGVSAANFSLSKIQEFCLKLGNPQLNYPVIHVAGTNGKGTTCYLLEKIYSDAGYKTGLFTSPHLIKYNERIRVGSREISDQQILEFFQENENLLSEIKLSYFEISTALAFWFFSKQEVELAIIETGLGGRLDSTNIVHSELSIITSIALDHQNVLGETIHEIAWEKAGIIKPGKSVILGNIDEEAESVIRNKAKEQNSRVYLISDIKPEWEKGKVSFEPEKMSFQTRLKESVNKWNIAAAYRAVKLMNGKFHIPDTSLIHSVKHFEGAPARFEKLHPRYEWYFSGSHNTQALDASLETLGEMKPIPETILVFSAMKDKVTEEFLDRFRAFKKPYFVEQEGERAAKVEDISRVLEVKSMTEDNSEIILNELKTELVIFTGSFYFYPIVKRWVKKLH